MSGKTVDHRIILKRTDYIYCEDCAMFVDFWKCGYKIEDTRHKGHKWRYVTNEELGKCITSCIEFGCFSPAGRVKSE